MKDPTSAPQTAGEALERILSRGLILIRSRADDGALCARVADYLHNLPGVLLKPTDEMLDFHWNVERRAFLREASTEEINYFAYFWEQLRPFVPHPKLDDALICEPTLRVAA